MALAVMPMRRHIMLGLGMGELLLILAIALLVFGPTKLPQLASGLGKAVRNFKKSSTAADEDPPRSLP